MLVPAVGAAVLAAGGVFAYLALQEEAPGAGPLVPGDPTSSSFVVPISHPFTFGLLIFRNPSTHVAILERIRLISPSHGVRLVASGAALVPTDVPNGMTATSLTFPPPHTRLRPVAGFHLPGRQPRVPRSYAQIVLGLQADKPGFYFFRRAELHYRIGSAHYRLVSPTAFSWCASTTYQHPGSPCRRLRAPTP